MEKETLIKRIRAFLKKDSPFEEESSNLLYLVRFILLMLCAYCVLMDIFIFANGVVFFGFVLLVTLVANIILLISSYSVKATHILYMLAVVSIISSGILTAGFGWRASFHTVIFVMLLAMWYNPSKAVGEKVVCSVLIAVSMCIISLKTPVGHLLFKSDSFQQTFLVYTNTLVFTACLSVVSYFFCTQYIEAERKLYLYNRELKKLSETDPLTKLPNRRYAEEELAELDKKQEAFGSQITVALGDIDFFKRVNDTYGHDAGDFILSSLAELFKKYMEEFGFVVRWGGEEFLFVFDGMNGDEAMTSLDKLRRKIEKKEFIFNEQKIDITMTFGVAEYYKLYGVENTVKEADDKLYMGKTGGRNQVVF